MKRKPKGMKIKGDQLVINEPISYGMLAIGSVFICIGLTQLNFATADQLTASLTCAAPFVLFGVVVMLGTSSKASTYIFDRRDRVFLVKKYPFMQPMKVERYPFKDLRTVEVESKSASEGGLLYYLRVITKDGRTVKFDYTYDTDREAERVLDQIKSFVKSRASEDV